jgi:exodeoxyribonuclease VII small subunit
MKLEQNLKQLDKLTKSLENGNASIEQSLKTFNEAVTLAKECLDEIGRAKGELEMLNTQLEKLKVDNG